MSAAPLLIDMADLVGAYQAQLPDRRSQKTAWEKARQLRALERALEPRGLLDATLADLRAWLKSLQLNAATERHYGGTLHDFYSWTVARQMIAANPADRLRRPRPLWHVQAVSDRPATVGQAAKAYIWDRYGRGEISEVSAQGLEARLNVLAGVCGPERPVELLDRHDIAEYQHHIGHLAPASRRAYLSTVKVFCRWAIAEGLMETDPTESVARVREPRRVPRALRSDDVARLLGLAAEDPRNLAIVWLMVGCGLRAIEVARLELADYDERALTLFVRGKGGHERVLPVPQPVAAAIDGYLRSAGVRSGPLIRPEDRGYGPGHHMHRHHVSQLVTALMYRAGIKRDARDGITPHALRHTCASDVLDRCGNVRTVQAILGHASLSTTEIYLRRANLDQMRSALEGRTYNTTEDAVTTG